MIILETTMGNIEIELFEKESPISTANFLRYVDEGFYDGTIFHRVIPGFMIQGGGLNGDLHSKLTHGPIKNEAENGLKNVRGTLAMARTSEVDSATAQFFINLADNGFLDHSSRDFGYAVFGRVAAGMEVVDRIAAVATGSRAGHRDVPVETITVKSARRK